MPQNAEAARHCVLTLKALRGGEVSANRTDEQLDRDADLDQSDDTAELAAQMEWDPQTDVASPMLPLQGVYSRLDQLVLALLQQF